MDLDEAGTGVEVGAGLRGYRTLEELYHYCYLVASVVGLVTIKIFGYSDPRAEELAKRTGIAFQLTNILRDVKEDAERGRLYLPMEVLTEFGVMPEDIVSLAKGREPGPHERGLVHGFSAKAWDHYAAAGALLPLIDADSRAALWVMVKIYSGLLAKIDLRNGDVVSERVRVPTSRKLAILVQGAGMALRNRVSA
jgi:phytoene synthase